MFHLIAAIVVGSLGNATEDSPRLAFVPVTHCRVVDTRKDTILTCPPSIPNGCVFTVSSISAWIVAGDASREAFKDQGRDHLSHTMEGEVPMTGGFPFSFADQGGNPDGCGVPLEAKAVVLNIAINPIHPKGGHVRVWEYETFTHIAFNGARVPAKPPKSSELNWPSDHNLRSWFNSVVTVEICDPLTAKFHDCNEDILIQPFGGSAIHLVVDVQGYFVELY